MQQQSYSRLWDGYSSDQEAKQARDAAYKELKSQGKKVRRSVLKNQLRQYWGFGQPCGESCDVYYLTVL